MTDFFIKTALAAIIPPCPTVDGACDVTKYEMRHLIELGVNVINFMLEIAAVIAVIATLYGGLVILTSAGSAERMNTGKRAATAAVVGLVIILSSFVILNTLIVAFTKCELDLSLKENQFITCEEGVLQTYPSQPAEKLKFTGGSPDSNKGLENYCKGINGEFFLKNLLSGSDIAFCRKTKTLSGEEKGGWQAECDKLGGSQQTEEFIKKLGEVYDKDTSLSCLKARSGTGAGLGGVSKDQGTYTCIWKGDFDYNAENEQGHQIKWYKGKCVADASGCNAGYKSGGACSENGGANYAIDTDTGQIAFPLPTDKHPVTQLEEKKSGCLKLNSGAPLVCVVANPEFECRWDGGKLRDDGSIDPSNPPCVEKKSCDAPTFKPSTNCSGAETKGECEKPKDKESRKCLLQG